MRDINPVRVLFVCMGNICRSPTAHGVFRDLVESHNLSPASEVDSAGTHSYHVGSPPDLRSQATARSRGVDLSDLRARRFVSADFHGFDYLLAMDNGNLADMNALRPADTPKRAELMLRYSRRFDEREIPDPYYGNDGFDLVYDMVEDAARGLLLHIREKHGL